MTTIDSVDSAVNAHAQVTDSLASENGLIENNSQTPIAKQSRNPIKRLRQREREKKAKAVYHAEDGSAKSSHSDLTPVFASIDDFADDATSTTADAEGEENPPSPQGQEQEVKPTKRQRNRFAQKKRKEKAKARDAESSRTKDFQSDADPVVASSKEVANDGSSSVVDVKREDELVSSQGPDAM